MGIQGAQDFWVVGSRMYVQRDPISGVVQPTIDLGVIKEVAPSFEPDQAELFDTDGGDRVLVDQALTQFTESYQATIANFNNNNLALLFNSNPVAAFTQTATPLTDIKHYAHPGEMVKLLNDDFDAATPGVPIFNLTSVDGVTGPAGTPTYTEGTDWEVVDLSRGLIRMIDGGAFSSAGPIEVGMTPVAVTGNRLIAPQSANLAVRAKAWLFLGRGSNTQQHVREMDVAITAESANFTAEDFSDFVLNFSVINDLTNLSQPAGRLLYFKGDLPSVS
jgi:2-keto-4-pentenoate hydratase/2-oxohepta-3-ene-1,7-dioic acid hydratase in catechol pathway